jgi:hypothetical protein
VNFALNTWDTVVVPAIGGTNTLLTSALEQAGSQLEAVVITSSVAALWNRGAPEGYVTTEADENNWAIEAAKNVDADGIPEAQRGGIMYAASKAAALRAVQEFRDSRKVGSHIFYKPLPVFTTNIVALAILFHCHHSPLHRHRSSRPRPLIAIQAQRDSQATLLHFRRPNRYSPNKIRFGRHDRCPGRLPSSSLGLREPHYRRWREVHR